MKLVTLIIPTYNRPAFLKRILTYYNSFDLEFEITVADSSYSLNKELNKKTIQLFPKLNILYLDHFSPKLTPHRKYAQMFEFVKTKYVVFCADDDFIVPEGIKKATKFLEKNPDYLAVHGTYISFYVSKGLYGQKRFLWKFINTFESITSPKAEVRLTSHFSHYYQILFSVRRADIVKKCYREYVRSKIYSLAFGELLPDMLMLIYGKMKRIDTLYGARQAFSSVDYTWPSLKQDIKEDNYNNEYTEFKNYLVTNLIKSTDLSKEKTERLIEVSMRTYLKYTTQQHLVGKIYFTLKKYPAFISDWLRFLHIRYLFLKDKKDRVGRIDNPSSRYFNDFNNIRKSAMEIEM